MKEFIDKLINELEKLGEHCLYMNNWQGQTAICDAIEIVNELAEEYKLFEKTEQVKGVWIPVSERLPKEDERILCLHSDGFIDCGVLIGETWCCDMDEYAVIRDDIHAWMPLPAPYTEGE